MHMLQPASPLTCLLTCLPSGFLTLPARASLHHESHCYSLPGEQLHDATLLQPTW